MSVARKRTTLEMFTLDEVFPGIYDEHAKLILTHLAEIIGMDISEFASLIEVHPSQVYKNQVRRNRDVIEKIETLVTTLARAAKARQDVKSIDAVKSKVMRWFATPNPAFDNVKPVEVLREGKFRKLQSYADQLLAATAP